MLEQASRSWQHQDYLFPRIPDTLTSEEEFFDHYGLAHWSLTALENALQAATRIQDRVQQSKISNDLHQVEGITGVIVRRGVEQGLLSADL